MSKGLELRGVSVRYGKTDIVRDVSLSVAPGETLVLFGPSGAGKTVLLRAIAGLEPDAGGQVLVDGRDVSSKGPEARRMGVAFQNFALYPHMKAWANIASPLQARQMSKAEVESKVQGVATLLKIGHVLGNLPRALSNGQKQRTALARALVAEPEVLLLDDPLRNVDAKLRYEMRMELPRLLRRANAATIYVTQDHREAMALGDRIAVLVNGRVVQQGDPDSIYDAPATTEVARLFGDPPLNLVRAETGPAGIRALGLELPLRPQSSGPATLGLRPECIVVGATQAPGAAPATLVAATPLHERQVLLLRTADGEEILASTAGAAPAPGPVFFHTDPRRALLYDADSGQRREAAVRAEEMA